jgi:hypothetical protein
MAGHQENCQRAEHRGAPLATSCFGYLCPHTCQAFHLLSPKVALITKLQYIYIYVYIYVYIYICMYISSLMFNMSELLLLALTLHSACVAPLGDTKIALCSCWWVTGIIHRDTFKAMASVFLNSWHSNLIYIYIFKPKVRYIHMYT